MVDRPSPQRESANLSLTPVNSAEEVSTIKRISNTASALSHNQRLGHVAWGKWPTSEWQGLEETGKNSLELGCGWVHHPRFPVKYCIGDVGQGRLWVT
jgi:hypothetical protein